MNNTFLVSPNQTCLEVRNLVFEGGVARKSKDEPDAALSLATRTAWSNLWPIDRGENSPSIFTHHQASHRVQGGVVDERSWVGGARGDEVHQLSDGQRLGLRCEPPARAKVKVRVRVRGQNNKGARDENTPNISAS